MSIDFFKGEIGALAGENGAGKSTILKTLSGLVAPISGNIQIGSTPYRRIDRAHAAGVRLIPQEPVLVPELSVAENIFLGRLPSARFWTVDWNRTFELARALLEKVGLGTVDPRRPACDLSLSQSQLLQIARGISDGGRIFLFDEPTSCLSPSETPRLFAVLEELRRQGKVVIYVSHRLPDYSRSV